METHCLHMIQDLIFQSILETTWRHQLLRAWHVWCKRQNSIAESIKCCTGQVEEMKSTVHLWFHVRSFWTSIFLPAEYHETRFHKTYDLVAKTPFSGNTYEAQLYFIEISGGSHVRHSDIHVSDLEYLEKVWLGFLLGLGLKCSVPNFKEDDECKSY